MRTMQWAALGAVFGALAASPVAAQEKTITRADLPAAVERVVAIQSRGATIRGFSKEIEGGRTEYEMALRVGGHTKDIAMDSTGAVLEVEEEVALDSLPAVVRSALLARAAPGTIVKVESLTKHDRLVAYEAQVRTAGKRSEVQVGPDGKPLPHEE